MKKAIVFIADGSEEIEALTPVDYLRRAGVEVTLVGIGNGAIKSSGSITGALSDVAEARYVVCSHKVPVLVDRGIESFAQNGSGNELSAENLSDVDAVIVPGGMPGATNIAQNLLAQRIIRLMNETGRLVCAICAAPALVLPATGALDEKAWTCYPGMEKEAGDHAARYQSGVPFVHSGNVITGRGPGAAEEWSMEIVRTLCGEAVAQKVHDSSMQR